MQLQLKLDQTVEASQLLERGFNLLRTMLHQVWLQSSWSSEYNIDQGGTGEAAVLQFAEKLERLGHDRTQLEDALTRFGKWEIIIIIITIVVIIRFGTDQWDWFMPDSTVGAVLNSASGEAQTQVIIFSYWNYFFLSNWKSQIINFFAVRWFFNRNHLWPTPVGWPRNTKQRRMRWSLILENMVALLKMMFMTTEWWTMMTVWCLLRTNLT